MSRAFKNLADLCFIELDYVFARCCLAGYLSSTGTALLLYHALSNHFLSPDFVSSAAASNASVTRRTASSVLAFARGLDRALQLPQPRRCGVAERVGEQHNGVAQPVEPARVGDRRVDELEQSDA